MRLYLGPGKYVAICLNATLDGHHVKVFEVPERDPAQQFDSMEGVGVAAWFVNRVDRDAKLDKVYPLEIFQSLVGELCCKERGGEVDISGAALLKNLTNN